MHRIFHIVLGYLAAPPHRRTDDRGLSQSTENALLVAGAVAVAVLIVTAVTVYVTAKLPQP